MSISQNFPEEGPTLNLNFAGSKVLDPRITFARPSTLGDATYMDANGLIVTAAADEPRFDHKYENGNIVSLGLLVEESRENLVDYSESFDSWGSGNVDIGINTTTAPDGTQNADSLIERDQNYTGGAYRRKNVSIGSTYSGQLTFSVFLKSAEVTTVGLIIDIPELSDPRANVNLTSSTTSGNGPNSTYIVESFPNDWKRVSIASTDSLSNYTGSFAVGIYLNGYTGFDNTGNYGDKVFVWGAQLEKGAFPTSYIPTSGSQATRSPDNVSMTGTNFSDWYNQDEGTVYVRQKLRAVQDTGRNNLVYLINGGSGNDYFYNTKQGNTNIFVFGDGETTNYSRFADGGDSTDTKTAWAYDVSGNDFKAYYNGIEATNETDDNSPSATSHTQLELGATAGDKYCGHISQLTYYPTRLSNTVLQNLTK